MTPGDWIRAGEIVFDAPIFYNAVVKPPLIKDPKWYENTGVLVAKGGTLPYFQYVIREKGKVEIGTVSCGMCHTRVMADGTVIKGAQGNFPLIGPQYLTRRKACPQNACAYCSDPSLALRGSSPILTPGLTKFRSQKSLNGMRRFLPVLARQGSSVHYPTQVPDLIGVEERKYLDHSGLVRHRSFVDMMRYPR